MSDCEEGSEPDEWSLHDKKLFQIWVVFLKYFNHRTKSAIIHPTLKILQINKLWKDRGECHWIH
jgi:hypothetical protein